LLNDRLLLGLKGTMSEYELGLMRQRARQAYLQKVHRGCAMWEMPVGFVRTQEGQIEKHPDRQVQQVFDFILGTHPISTKGTTESGRSEATKRL